MRFEFSTATRIIFGNGTIKEIGTILEKNCIKPFVVTGQDSERAKILFEILESKGIEYGIFSVKNEPTTDIIMEGTQKARKLQCDSVIGFGGGSSIDTGKAIAAIMANKGELFDYLEVIGKGKPLLNPSIPFYTIPTTAGTGSEVTCNAVMESPKHKVKVSLRSAKMYARVAIVDPELTYSMPPSITAYSGLDAITQVIEPFVSNQANPMTDAICREGIRKGGRSLQAAYEKGENRKAREDLALTALLGGMALSNAKLGAVHGFAGPIGGMFPGGHGFICASLLPYVMEINVRALTKRMPDSMALARYDEIAFILTGNNKAVAKDGIEFIKSLCNNLRIPKLSSIGISKSDFPEIINKAGNASSMKGNPIQLTSGEMEEILNMSL